MEILISITVSLSGMMMEVSLLNMVPGAEIGLEMTEMTRKMIGKMTWKIMQNFVSMLFQTDNGAPSEGSNISRDIFRPDIPRSY